MTGTPETITRDELRAAVDRLGWYVERGEDATHPADRIIRDVERHREPEYEPGKPYVDAQGIVFLRTTVSGEGWLDFNGVWIGHDKPARPLRKLVPEGSQEAAAVLVAEWRGLGEQDDAVPAWRGGYRAALRKCADELEYALKAGASDEH